MSLLKILRYPKLFDMALFDWVSGFIVIFFINNYIQKYYKYKNRNLLDLIFVIIYTISGVVTHYYFKIDTKFGYYLNLNKDPRK